MTPLRALATLIARHAPQDGTTSTAIPRVELVRTASPQAPVQVLHEPALCLVVQGRKQVMLGQHTFTYDAAHYLAVSAALPVSGQILEATPERPYLCFRLNLDSSVLTTLLREMLSDVRREVTARTPGLTLAQVTPALLNVAVQLVKLLDSPEDISVLAPLLERELLYRAIKDDQLPLLRQIATEGTPMHQVNRALTWLRAHYTEPFSMKVLAAEARMSPSALYEHFRTVTTMSPLQYQKQLRLQEARRLLTSQRLGAAKAGYAVGYESPSQFSREYRRWFGVTPARDATH
ncbi:helix-turn-helix domain-containing protein [Deinococcus sp. HMF7620]|uniref:Helix-turn-helix domain-containing protein n=1 Tax=Deinococcus arboris TaxID=2682977 RepID=A0A7C9IDC0_9DEIO|nr:AraC family transcriptional regulator [Deinococcus arboris]MVN88226.1 helix-turn-helix domain-containing protein [Deinococcus arboris]